MPLGEWAAIARIQQRVIEEHYPGRYEMLNALGFIWWIPPGEVPRSIFAQSNKIVDYIVFVYYVDS